MRTATVGFGEGEIWCAGPPGSCMIAALGGHKPKRSFSINGKANTATCCGRTEEAPSITTSAGATNVSLVKRLLFVACLGMVENANSGFSVTLTFVTLAVSFWAGNTSQLQWGDKSLAQTLQCRRVLFVSRVFHPHHPNFNYAGRHEYNDAYSQYRVFASFEGQDCNGLRIGPPTACVEAQNRR